MNVDMQSLVPDVKILSAATVAGSLAAAYLLYRSILPKPLPGIPYNEEAARSPFGDLPSLMREVRRTRDFMAWVQKQVDRHQSPICQIFFLFPIWKPVVIVSDAREVQDIFLRRTAREFDRSVLMKTLLGGLAPSHHITKPTDGEWKANRRLLQDLMTPSFLRGVASGVIYQKATDLIRLWELKAEVADGKPFSAVEDIYYAALDAVLMFSFGERFGAGAISGNAEHLERLGEEERKKIMATLGVGGSVVFPDAELDRRIETILVLSASVEEVRRSPIRSLKWWYMVNYTLKEHLAFKKRFLIDELTSATERLQGTADEKWVRSAVDHMVSRENRLAEKEGRTPNFTSNAMLDEVFGFVLAGHETTSTTLLWALKILSDHPDVQSKIRSVLRDALPSAANESRLPTNSEIHDTTIPYLDAAIEEIFRCTGTISFNSRDAVCDTTILGHFIPKGTIVFMTQAGNGVRLPPFPIDEAKRSETSRAALASAKTPDWNVDDMGDFMPERWLKNGEFDSTAGLNLAFGLGTRGCYGRRLAYLELRTLLTLMLWRFELQKVPEELAGYEATDGLTHKPQGCFVRLKPVY